MCHVTGRVATSITDVPFGHWLVVVLFMIEPLAGGAGKAAEDGPPTFATITYVGNVDEAPGLGLAEPRHL